MRHPGGQERQRRKSIYDDQRGAESEFLPHGPAGTVSGHEGDSAGGDGARRHLSLAYGKPGVPFRHDVGLAYYPEAVYLIVTLMDRKKPAVRAFTIVEGTIAEVELIVKPEE